MERQQSCASRLRRGRARKARQKSLASVGVSLPNPFLSFLSVRHPCRSGACDTSTRHLLLQLSMDHRHRRPNDAVLRTAMPGGDDSESYVTVACHSSDAQMHRENDEVRPPPRKRGRGTMRSMVEGACDATRGLRRRRFVTADAPPTALRAVPPPRYAGRDE